jgi:hypothetical protein
MKIKNVEDCFSLVGKINSIIPLTVSSSQRSAIFNLVVTDISERINIDDYDEDEFELDVSNNCSGDIIVDWNGDKFSIGRRGKTKKIY